MTTPDFPKRTLEECNRILTAGGWETVTKTIKGRTIRTYKNLPASIRDLWAASAAFGDKQFLVYETERLSFVQTHAKVSKLASLLHERGVKKGDRVAIAMRNLPEWIIAWYAAHSLGAVLVCVNAWLSPDAFYHCLSITEPTAVFVDEERAEVLKSRVGELGGKAVFTVRMKKRLQGFEPLEETLAKHRAQKLPEIKIVEEDLATIFFTSGTTSLPKGVISTQRQYLTNRWNTATGGARSILRRGEDLPAPDPNAPQKVALIVVPLFHVLSNQSFLLLATTMGMSLVLLHKFDPPSIPALLRREGVTTAGGVPNMMSAILDEVDRSKEGWEGIKLEGLAYGGGPASERLPGEVRKRMSGKGTTGPSQGYGLTEVNSVATGLVAEDYYARPTSVGLPPPAVDLKIIDPASSHVASAKSLPVGTSGEICIHGPGVAEGYWRDEEATGKAFDKEGWFRSGDLGYLDAEGFLYLVDRAKDIIIRSGENISSPAVESALHAHDAVKEVAVVPVPCEVHGEQVAAVILLHPPTHPSRSPSSPPCTPPALQALVASLLPKHCVPALIIFPEEYEKMGGLPRNAAGKVVKGEVREVAKREWERRGLGKRSGKSKL